MRKFKLAAIWIGSGAAVLDLAAAIVMAFQGEFAGAATFVWLGFICGTSAGVVWALLPLTDPKA